MEYANNSYQKDAINSIINSLADALPDGFEEYSDPSGISLVGPDGLLHELLCVLSGASGELGAFCSVVVLSTLLIALASFLSSGRGGLAFSGVSLSVSLMLFSSLYPLFSSVAETLSALGGFFSALLPVLLSYLSLSGGVATAAVASGGAGLTLWICGAASGSLLLPFVSAVFASSALSALGGSSERLALRLKKLFVGTVGAIGFALGSFFALQTYVSVSADGFAIRTAKYTAANIIPIVGQTVSGALSALTGGISMLGGRIGAAGVSVIVAISLSPLVILLAHKLVLYLASLTLELVGAEHSGVMTAFIGALDSLISVYVMTTIIYIFEIIVIIWGGESIIGA